MPVCFRINLCHKRTVQRNDDLYETLLTNLPEDAYPPDRLRGLYNQRWGIETSFRSLKYTTGLLHLHSKKVACIKQEIYAKVIMYNFTEMVTSLLFLEVFRPLSS
ncbi:MAG: transposase [Lachnospiraceae bacterium]|nr:transposase [Lachnospiraceae bacterium]